MTYREPTGEKLIPCARCGRDVPAGEALFSHSGQRICAACDRAGEIARSADRVIEQAAEERHERFVLANVRLLVAGGVMLFFGVIIAISYLMDPIIHAVHAREPLPATASADAQPWPGGILVAVHGPPHSTVDALGRHLEIGSDRRAALEVPRAEVIAGHGRAITIRVAPCADDARDFNAESITVSVPPLIAQPDPPLVDSGGVRDE